MDYLPGFWIARAWCRRYCHLRGRNAAPVLITSPAGPQDATTESTKRTSTPDSVSTQEGSSRTPLPPVRKPRRHRPEDPIEAFFDMLVEAVDRDAARASIQTRLQDLERWISATQKELTGHICRSEFIQTRVASEPVIAKALELVNNKIEVLRSQMEEWTGEKNVLKRRLAQSTRELARLFHQIYAQTDMFLASLGKTGKLRVEVGGSHKDFQMPHKVAMELRLAAKCSQLCDANTQHTRRSRSEFLSACDSAKPSHSPGRQRQSRRRKRKVDKYDAMQRQESYQKVLLSHQEEREQELLRVHLQPFLVYIGKMRLSRRESDASSNADVLRIDFPRVEWGGENGPMEVPNDGIHPKTADAQQLLQTRHDLMGRRKALDGQSERYTNIVADYLYAFPKASKDDYDNVVFLKNNGVLPGDYEQQMLDDIDEIERDYAEEREIVRASGNQDHPLSPHWAGSVNDVPPSQSSSLAGRLKPAVVHRRRRKVQRYARDCARHEDDLVRPSASPSSRSSKNPLTSPPLWYKAPHGENGSTLEADALQRRIQRTKTIAAHLRSQFERYPDGPTYHRSPV